MIQHELSRAPDSVDPDEGRLDKGYLYRRGLTKAKRQELDAADRQGRDLDEGPPGSHPWQYVIIYRSLNFTECIKYQEKAGIMVERIVSEAEMAGVFLIESGLPYSLLS
ncbi:hypothetical protein [Streptomyces sp. NPDC051636]|uniref:hypothetical protein n=1 Tax=Streptomyces sp. NPDC051636 TaxID=3365663 RepID=UPI0037A947B3